MSCCSSGMATTRPLEEDQDSYERKRITIEIENQLKEDKKKLKNTIKILLLGCGEAGKSTFIKQMKILHSADEEVWTEDERRHYRRDVLSNALECLQILLEEMTGQLQEGLGNRAKALLQLDKEKDADHARLWEWRDTLQDIWKDPAVVATFNRRNQFTLPDCCRHFLSDIARISDPDYIPDVQDILQIRVRTCGVVEHGFNLVFRAGLIKECKMIDVGGQRNERKKWINMFDDVLMVMFLAAASEYDQTLDEETTMNRMEESLNLFHTIISYHWFRSSSIALFLNKKDLLEEKIKTSPLEDYFEEFRNFPGYKTRDYTSAMNFIKDMFRQEHKEVEKSHEWQRYNIDGHKRPLYVHETMATDTSNISTVFSDVKTTILTRILENVHVVN